jgi:uncharacterized protein YjbI with pentapeptide repeats
MSPILPAIPPVRPRVIYDGDDRPLDEVVEELLADGVRGVVELAGEPGCGKTTALALLAARHPDEPSLMLVDRPTQDELESLPPGRLCIVASTMTIQRPTLRLPIAPWRADQLIEYLLEVHPDVYRPVMSRLGSAARRTWPPYLATIMLDRFASNPAACDPESEICNYVRERLKPKQLAAAQELSLALLIANRGTWLLKALDAWRAFKIPPNVRQMLLVHQMVQLSLASDALLTALRSKAGALPESIPRDLAMTTGRRCRETAGLVDVLRQLIADPQQRTKHSTIASLLATADPTWIPPMTTARPYHFRKASLQGVEWPAVDLREADLTRADFSGARLNFARLSNSRIVETNFSGADLCAADLMRSCGPSANFTAAILTQANLTDGEFINADFDGANLGEAQLTRSNLRGASFSSASFNRADLSAAVLIRAKMRDADCSDANFHGANLYDVDLRSATLTNANFEGALLSKANLEAVCLPEAKLRGARLDSAQLTGSVMTRGCLNGASLIGAKLAEIDWENADLRGANLEGATFHMGSSRSGLVNSPIALEGNMTGFYNDDFEDRCFKRPEEIRKANLRGADLRGAKLGNINFYLVDLRDAKLDPDALRHARNCGAILDDVAAA